MKRIRFIIINIFTILACTGYCQQTIKIAFLAPTEKNGQILATYNGVLDILDSLSSKYSDTFKLEYFNCNKSSKTQSMQIEDCLKNGFKGVIVLPISSDSLIADAINKNSKLFPIVVLGDNIANVKSLCYIGTDNEKFKNAVTNIIQSKSKDKSIEVFCYLKSTTSAFEQLNLDDSYRISPLLNDSIDYKTLNEILKNYSPTIYAIDFYSIFEQTHKNEIRRRDDYGEIFVDPTMLLAPLNQDDDRIFAISIGATAQTEIQLASNSITACVYDDYYGWGYFAGRTLAEKIVENIDPSLVERRLPPVVATPSSIESFRKDWKIWSK